MSRTHTITALLLVAAQSVTAAPLLSSRATDNATTEASVWDYIIVGSGAGGIPVAANLAASGARTLLIERGPPSSGRWTTAEYGGLADPAWKPDWLANSNLTTFDVMSLYTEIWTGNYSADIFCPDVAGGIAGCVLGGGTAINAGLWWRPADIDWDYTFPSGIGWSSGDMQNVTDRVFEKIPGTSTPSTNGELYLQEGAHVIEGALRQAGWEQEVTNDMPNQKTQRRVFGNTTFMYEHGERGGPMATYLVDALQRPNFSLWTNTLVERVLRNSSTATGLSITSGGVGGHSGTVSLSGKGGIIISAGAFGTPKILFRSGIGPQDQLEIVKEAEGDLMIDESDWINLPVGYNLADNINTDIVFTHPSVVNYDWTSAYSNPIPPDAASFLTNRTGPLTQTGSNLNPMIWEPLIGTDGFYKQLQWTARVATSLGVPNPNGTVMTISNYLGLGQWTRARTTINANLTMQAGYVAISANAADRAAIIQGLTDMRAALSNVTDLTILQPAGDISSEDYVDQTEHAPVNHWLGSCKLGTDDGRVGGQSVVDPDTRVYGMENLFVVDASIFPGLTTSNPSAAIVIAAERAAERILALVA